MKVNVIPHSSKQNTHFLIIADLHEESLDRKAFDIMLKYARMMGISNLIILGDLLDLPYFMEKNSNFQTWNKRKEGIEEFFLPEFEKSCLWANTILDELQAVFKNIHFIYGNHDSRVQEFQEKHCPCEYKHHFDLSIKLNLDNRKIKYCLSNDYFDVGAAALTHGEYHGPTHAKKHYEAAEARNVFVGHVHKDEKFCFVSRGKTRQVQSLPCLSNLNPLWIKNRSNNWTLGFGHLIIKPNGHFNYYCQNIWDDELCIQDGRIIR